MKKTLVFSIVFVGLFTSALRVYFLKPDARADTCNLKVLDNGESLIMEKANWTEVLLGNEKYFVFSKKEIGASGESSDFRLKFFYWNSSVDIFPYDEDEDFIIFRMTDIPGGKKFQITFERSGINLTEYFCT